MTQNDSEKNEKAKKEGEKEKAGRDVVRMDLLRKSQRSSEDETGTEDVEVRMRYLRANGFVANERERIRKPRLGV